MRRAVFLLALATLLAAALVTLHPHASISRTSATPDFLNFESLPVHPLEITPDGTRLLAVNVPDARLEVFAIGGMSSSSSVSSSTLAFFFGFSLSEPSSASSSGRALESRVLGLPRGRLGGEKTSSSSSSSFSVVSAALRADLYSQTFLI